MLEDIVLLETSMANPKKQVFVLQFPVGEFDMAVFDPADGSCQIFEIKHSTQAVSSQYRHLTDLEKCAQTEHRYGPITGKFVFIPRKESADGWRAISKCGRISEESFVYLSHFSYSSPYSVF